MMARVLRSSLVAPSPSGHDLELSLPLTYLDAMWLHIPPVERVFLYPHGVGAATDAVVSRLQDSLSRALRAFYPLAGRLRLAPSAPGRHRYELHYRPGDAVTFTVAECTDVGVDELAADGPTELARIAPLVPPLPRGGAVLALQATVLLGGGGGLALALGVTVHHAACDGACSTHFLHAWAAACAGAPAPEPPVIGRDFIRDRDGLHDICTAPRPSGDGGPGRGYLRPPGVVDQLLLATFTLSDEHLQGIKDTVAGEAARRGAPPPRRSTSIVATFGFIWQCHCRALPCSEDAEHSGGHAYLLFAADQRARLEPPVPDKYLGNCVVSCLASAPRTEVAAGGAHGLLAACAAVAAAIDEAVRGGPSYWDGYLKRGNEAFSAGPPLAVAGSPRFSVYDVDFGFGRPAKLHVVSAARTGAMSVAEARHGGGGGGGGGIEVGISLPPDGMGRFRRCFADAIACLSSPPLSARCS